MLRVACGGEVLRAAEEGGGVKRGRGRGNVKGDRAGNPNSPTIFALSGFRVPSFFATPLMLFLHFLKSRIREMQKS